ncbi:hypothetical protein H8B15_14785 [Hymenobacter sp. BT507]|uniref:Quercetin 2,3-dioxygenase C-terminal cupin domain-containing protein n=1 Tax=Hymenobacter citatus TaxID=2763506 RepID=A0ABR7MNR1_9BACT|nr:hypothetical protein [Hymenobacter citatus]MBC6612192.1 hypothetical protein [Hymenobacter citatus]
MTQASGKIFLADQRGVEETAQFRRYSTLQFGAYCHEHKQALGRLLAVNEELVVGGARVTVAAAQAVHVLIIPITGAVQIGVEAEGPVQIDVEEMYALTVPAGSTLHFTNPYDNALIDFLHLWIAADPAQSAAAGYVSQFSFAAIAGRLLPLLPPIGAPNALPCTVSLGRFDGRQEVVYPLAGKAQFFAFVLAGAFEAEGRLLHEKDGLALWDTKEVELEALSNGALLVVVELPA